MYEKTVMNSDFEKRNRFPMSSISEKRKLELDLKKKIVFSHSNI